MRLKNKSLGSMMDELTNPLEYDECVTFADYLEKRGFLYSHIPNETFTRSWGTKMRNKKQGVKKGTPDYIVIKNNKLIFVEIKRQRGGTISPEQKMWIEKLNQCGAFARVCRGSKDAIDFIESI